MNDEITITVNGERQQYRAGITVREVLEKQPVQDRLYPLGALYQNHLAELDYRLDHDCSLRVLTFRDREGFAIYRRSATMVLIEAVRRLYPSRPLTIGQSLADGYYFDLDLGHKPDKVELEKIKNGMEQIVEEDISFGKMTIPYQEAKAYFAELGAADKVKLLDYLRSPEILLSLCGESREFYTGPLALSTGQIKIFGLIPYGEGFILRFPDWGVAGQLPSIRSEKKLYTIFRESRRWNEVLAVENVGQLNELCVSGKVRDLILVAEAFHARKIAAIADEISARSERVKLVLIAGPSASGKTTLAKKLAIQLRVNGLQPILLSMDNYFKDRSQTPKDHNGDLDFEALVALDLELFHRHLKELTAGIKIEAPIFSFKSGKRKKITKPIKITGDRILLIEGIHSLNNQVSAPVPIENKFRIYINALTQIRLDNHTRIFTSDTRLLRRIVRDRIFRGWSGADTIQRWPLVRRGEKENIFPFQEEADAMFNSALFYELAVLKNYAELALLDITPDQAEYVEAERLLDFLNWFAPISESDVPSASILREFIGKSFFAY